MENLFLINIFLLVALLFYKEKKQEKIIKEIPLDDMSAEEILGVLQKNK